MLGPRAKTGQPNSQGYRLPDLRKLIGPPRHVGSRTESVGTARVGGGPAG
jgi:hypothetical protein